MAILRKKEQNQTDLYCTKEQLNVNLAQDLSDHAAELLWGQGFNVTHKVEVANKRLKELIKYNRMNEFWPYLEKLLSLRGNMYTTIDMVNGNPTLTICDPNMNSNMSVAIPSTDGTIYGMGRAFVTDELAVVWKRITFGTVSFPIKEIHYKDRVERIFFGENQKRITVAAVNEQLPKEMQLEEVWQHNLGVVLAHWHKNIPTFGAASWPDGYKGDSLQALVDKTLSELWHETETNRTRIIGNLDENTYNQIVKNGQLQDVNKTDFLVNVKFHNTAGTNNNQLIPLTANPKFDSWWLSYQKAKDEYFQLGGYSPLGDGRSEKTATENLLMKTNDYQTTKKKRDLRLTEMTEVFSKIMLVDTKFGFGNIYGAGIDDLQIEIMENKVMDSLQEVENIKSLIEIQLMSRVEAIARLRGVTKKEAEQIYAEITKEAEAYEAKFGEPDGDEGDSNESKSRKNK